MKSRLLTLANQHTIAACLDLACETNITEILREAGPEVSTQSSSLLRSQLNFLSDIQGSHVKDIAAKNKLHPDKLGIMWLATFVLPPARVNLSLVFAARALRLLATHHVFLEVRPDVFANNSLSSVLDTGKSTETLFTQYVGTTLQQAYSV